MFMKNPSYNTCKLIIIVLHLAVLIAGLVLNNHMLKDSMEYLYQAQNIAEHGISYAADYSGPVDPKYFSRRPPGYALFLMATGVFGSKALIIILQTFFSLAICFLALKLAYKSIGDKKTLFAVPAGLLLFPSLLVHTQFIMADILFMALIFMWFWFSRNYFITQKPKLVWGANISLAAALFVKPVLLYFWPVNLAVLVWYSLKQGKKLTWFPGLFPAVVVLIVGWMNLQHTGHFHYSSIQASNIVSYNAYPVAEKLYGTDSAGKLVREWYYLAEQENSLQAQMESMKSKATELIFDHPVHYGMYHVNGMINFFLDPGRYDIVNFFGMETSGEGLMAHFQKNGYSGILQSMRTIPVALLASMAIVFLWNIFLLVAFVWFIFAGPMEKFTKVLAVLMVLYIVFVTGPVGTARYKVDIYPLLLFTAPLFLEYIRQKKFTNR